MFDFFVRVELRPAPWDDDASFDALIARVRTEVDQRFWAPLSSDDLVRGEVMVLNGVAILLAQGVRNHDHGRSIALVELLELLGDLTPASYGFVWHRDTDVSECWTVHTLRGGIVEEGSDPWFSPTAAMESGAVIDLRDARAVTTRTSRRCSQRAVYRHRGRGR